MHVKSQGTSCGAAVGVGNLRGRVEVFVLVLVLRISGDELWCCCWCWRSQATSCGVGFGVGDLRGRVVVLLLLSDISGDEIIIFLVVRLECKIILIKQQQQ